MNELKQRLRCVATGCALVISLQVQAADMPTRQFLPLATAQQLATEAMNSCTDFGYNVSVAVVDASGLTLTHLRNNLAGPHTLESSRRKAFTAASLGRSTAELAKLIKEMPESVGLRDMDPNILILGGGLPISVNGELLGGIGVGGAPGGNLDQSCAKVAIEKVFGGS